MGRRWTSGSTATISGLDFRVVEGVKAPGDLRVEWRTPTGWHAVEMAAAFYLTDFFVENEDHLKQYRPHWTQSAADFFFGHLWKSVHEGWTAAREVVVRDREAMPRHPSAASSWCREPHPMESVVCTRHPEHGGPHKWNDELVWPRERAA